MKKLLISAASLPLMTFLLTAQDSPGAPQSWSGLLVAAGCQDTQHSSVSGRNGVFKHEQPGPARLGSLKDGSPEARATNPGSTVDKTEDALSRTTTPPVDDQGTRGQATLNNTAAADAANRANSKPTASKSDSDIAKGMDASCRIGHDTSTFALRLLDGTLVRFDDASNSKIAQQLQSGDRLQHKTKIFRARIKGTLQNGVVSADSIQI